MIELQNLCVGYAKTSVLEGLDLTIQKGELTAIIGTNGCGKTTLLKTILGLLPPTEGTVKLDGDPISALSRIKIAQRVAYVAQSKDTPDMTVLQLVLHGRFPYLHYPRRYSKRDMTIAKSALEALGIAHLADRRLETLSGGMRQSAYLAMALTQKTEYILLDEPTTHLDISNTLELMHLLRAFADQGKGIVAVLHDLPLAMRFADRIVLLHDGRLAACDTPTKLLEDGTLAQIFGVSLQKAPNGTDFYVESSTLR
ncbi:MAG: ABC transporter ATP-binding protein [Ruminococcaceae bacterium]|nr:ABC transporter ATP-binding protein [Oscillospiraceae bacterium]